MKYLIKKTGITAVYLFLTVTFLLMVFPLAYAFLASFKTNLEILSPGGGILPKRFMVENYVQAWTLANFARYTWNSVYFSAIVVVLAIFLGTMSGYVYARGDFPGKKALFAVFVSAMFISVGSIGYYPLLQIAKGLNIQKSLFGVILIRSLGVNMPTTFLVASYLDTIPKQIDESAKIDGCSFFRIYWHIIFPIMTPMIATIGLMSFMGAWNEYLLPMIFTIANLDNAPLIVGIVAMKSSGTVASQWNLMLAGTMISVIPLLAVYALLNKHFMSGLTTGAVKG